MEFCPKCGTLLVPKKINRSSFLTCPRCGYKKKTRKSSSYKISEKGKKERDVAVITEVKKVRKPKEREYEIEPPEYEEESYE
jgi:DNA-directed RNA polymerase subunit M